MEKLLVLCSDEVSGRENEIIESNLVKVKLENKGATREV
jgi:hypothetical protein